MAPTQNNSLGLYISVPFCRSKCTYCNFASGVYPASEHARYIQRAIEDIHSARRNAQSLNLDLPHQVDTIYIGGGTPTLLPAELFQQLFAAIHAEFAVLPTAEITIECAPGQFADTILESLTELRVNRVSLGVQSFIDSEARSSGRLHARAIISDDLRRLHSVGIENINIDLIAGLAGQTAASWQESLRTLVDANVPHASVYMLEVDEDSRLGREILSGGARYHASIVPSDETIIRMYQAAIETFADAGIVQYEISNFSQPGSASHHNLRYWHRKPYLGVGLDASSMLCALPQAERYANHTMRATTTDNLKSYLDNTPSVEMSWLSPERQHEEAWFLGLRLNEGVSITALEREFGASLVAPAREVVEQQIKAGLLTRNGDTVRLTPQGRLLSNNVFQEFLDLHTVVAESPR